MPFKAAYLSINKLCTPSDKSCPDLTERTLIATKTKAQLAFYIFFLIVALIQLSRNTMPFFPQIVRISQVSALIATLLLCCRSYLHVYYLIITLILSFGTMIVTIRGDMLYAPGSGFFATIIIYIITDKWYYSSLTALTHICNYQIFLKEKMEITIDIMGSREFSNKVTDICTFQLIMTILMLCPLHLALRKLNHDLWKSKVETEYSLSYYKTFLFSFSHEIRNPINILLGSLELALQEYLPNSALDLIQTAKISGELLLQLINNVLDVGKAEVGKLEIVPTPTRAHDLLIRMWSICSELIKKKKLSGYLKISTNLPEILELDPDRINQVLLNLMGNAVKFTEKGNVNLTVEWLENQETVSDKSFRPVPFDNTEEGVFDKNEIFSTLGYVDGAKPGHLNDFYVVTHTQRKMLKGLSQELKSESTARKVEQNGILKIIVKDQGCGMSKEAMKGLFKKFYQCSNEASQRKRGTGLGLYITKDICESMGGEIRVYSEEERGAVFIACIPCRALIEQY